MCVGGILHDIYFEKLVKLLEVKLTKNEGPLWLSLLKSF